MGSIYKNSLRAHITNQGMENLIMIVNKMQDAFTTVGVNFKLDLPQIAVVGGQSSGKSSVLESFVGRDFLPRGPGIVTRRPLILQLVNDQSEYGQFYHKRDIKFTDFEAIRQEIQTETDRLIGRNKNISEVPINLRMFSPNVLNLTLIDLPGLIKVPVGNQPKDIEKLIRDMINSYICKKTCLILAVTPANTNLANSDALKLAKEVDPQGHRTIGVITKLDLMDEGTDAQDILENRLLPLKRGYIGVVNRSQKDIEGSKDIQAALADEQNFFKNHPKYRHLADRLGTPHLQKVLNAQLTNHIRDTMPGLKEKLQKQVAGLEKELGLYLNGPDADNPGKAISRIVYELNAQFQKNMKGYDLGTVGITEFSGGAKIHRIFKEKLGFDIFQRKDEGEKLNREVAFAIANIQGYRGGLFTPSQAFDAVVKAKISQLKSPMLECVDAVMTELDNAVRNCLDTMDCYPRLQDEVRRIINTHLLKCEQQCREMLQKIIEFELAYMNINHEDFIGVEIEKVTEEKKGNPIITLKTQKKDDIPERPKIFKSTKDIGILKSWKGYFPRTAGKVDDTTKNDKVNEEVLQNPLDNKSKPQVEQIRKLTESYMKIIIKNVRDIVPKVIIMMIINDLTSFLSSELLAHIYAHGDLKTLMEESSDAAAKKEEKLKLYTAFKDSLKIIGELSVTSTTTSSN